MGEHREFIGSYERMGEGVWSVDDQIADTSQEVVRCRDCKHFVEGYTYGVVVGGRTPDWCVLRDYYPTDGDRFCAWGERKVEQ